MCTEPRPETAAATASNPIEPWLVLGTRPEVIKLAPVFCEMLRRGLHPRVISTGQQRELVHQACDVLSLPVDVDLDLMRHDQSPAGFLARSLAGLDELLGRAPRVTLVVQGDTTTALAGALAAHYAKIDLVHVEAGLRTYDLHSPFPEEGHRQLIGRLASLHCCPTPEDAQHLLREGVPATRIVVVGNTVIDTLLHALPAGVAARPSVQPRVLVTTHRRENFDDRLHAIISAVRELAQRHRDYQFILPVHPNPNVGTVVRDLLGAMPNVQLTAPLDYFEFIEVMAHCRFVITDSGGVQEEAPALGKPVIVVRDITERPLGVSTGVAFMVGARHDLIVDTAERLLSDSPFYRQASHPRLLYGDGRASERIVARLLGETHIPFTPER